MTTKKNRKGVHVTLRQDLIDNKKLMAAIRFDFDNLSNFINCKLLEFYKKLKK